MLWDGSRLCLVSCEVGFASVCFCNWCFVFCKEGYFFVCVVERDKGAWVVAWRSSRFLKLNLLVLQSCELYSAAKSASGRALFLYVVYLREMVRQKEKICWSFLFVCRFGFYCVGCKLFSEGLCGSWCRSSCERWSGRSCWCCCQNGWLMLITDDTHCHYPSNHKAWGKWYHKFIYKHRSQQEAPYALLNGHKMPSIWGRGTPINKVHSKYTRKFLNDCKWSHENSRLLFRISDISHVFFPY